MLLCQQVVQCSRCITLDKKMDYVCTAVRFAMDQLGVSTLKDKRRRLFTTLFEAMTASLFFQRGTGKRCAMPCYLSCSTI